MQKPDFVINANNTVRLPDVDSGPNNNLVRVHNLHMKHFKRWMAVCITNTENGKWTIRYIVGANHLKGLTLTSLGVDYDARVELAIKDNHDAKLTLKKATFWQVQIWLWKTPNLHNRYGNYWGVLGTILGLIGIIGML